MHIPSPTPQILKLLLVVITAGTENWHTTIQIEHAHLYTTNTTVHVKMKMWTKRREHAVHVNLQYSQML